MYDRLAETGSSKLRWVTRPYREPAATGTRHAEPVDAWLMLDMQRVRDHPQHRIGAPRRIGRRVRRVIRQLVHPHDALRARPPPCTAAGSGQPSENSTRRY